MPTVSSPAIACRPPSPYTPATASDAMVDRPTRNQVPSRAVRTPRSRRSRAGVANRSDSVAGSPKTFTRWAPETLNRSFMTWPRSASTSMPSRVSTARRRPNQRAGSTNSGTRARAPRVSSHDMVSIAASVKAMVSVLETTVCRVEVKARWAPSTSPLRRCTRAPVRAREKNARGMRCTWSNTAIRRSRMSPSPTCDETSRSATESPAARMASSAAAPASRTTNRVSPSTMPWSMIRWKSRGVAAPAAASRARTSTNTMSLPR